MVEVHISIYLKIWLKSEGVALCLPNPWSPNEIFHENPKKGGEISLYKRRPSTNPDLKYVQRHGSSIQRSTDE
jgi:hypothetical protein